MNPVNMGKIRRVSVWVLGWVILLCVLCGCDQLSWLNPPSSNRPFVKLELPEPPADGSESDQTRWGLLYFADSQKRILIPVYRPIPHSETIIRDTLNRLIPSPEAARELSPKGLQFVLPEQSAILGISLNEGLAKVDFSAPILNYSPEDERLVLGSILCTLRQFPEIERLQILVEGAEVERFPGGASGLTPLGPECWINLEVEEGLEDYRNFSAVKIYFCYSSPAGDIFYVPVTRILAPDEQPESAAFRELLAGPRPGSGLFSEIPPGTELWQLTVQGTMLTLNFSKQLLTYRGGRTGAKNIVHQLLLTAAAIPQVEQVQILIDGQPANIPGELDFSAPLSLPGPVNRF